jgi:predicted GIY-YIG superfamily endonuclease
MPCIYKITNTINGKVYIGQTIQPLDKRWSQHKRSARMKEPYSIHRAIAKYG